MITNIISRLAGWSLPGLAAVATVALISAPSFAEDAKPEVKKDEWPCIYRKVPQLTAAMIWDEVETIADRMGEDASATISDVSLKLRVALDLVDEQDPVRKLILSATNDLTILAAAQRPDFRLA